MKATLYPCPFTSVGCDIYNCQNRVRWYVGRPDGPASVTFKLCDECAKNLVATAPAELVEGGADLESKLEAKFEKKLAAEKAKFEEVAGGLQNTIGELIVKVKKQNEKAAAPVVEEKPPEEVDTSGAVYRCLECDKEFETKSGLSAHMRKHKN